MKIKSLLSLFLFSLASFVYAENLRGFVSGISSITDNELLTDVPLKLDEIAFFEIASENPFLEGMEILIQIPRDLQNYRNSFALFLYKDISPVPNLRLIDYEGSRVIMHILPTQNMLSIKIPFTEDHNLVKDATSIVTSAISIEDFPLALTLLPIMKGIPDSAYESSLNIKVLPIYEDKGGLDIQIEGNEDLLISYQFYLDGQELVLSNEMMVLNSGMHSLVISSPSSNPVEYNIPIEKGKIYQLTHRLESQPSILEIPLQEGIQIWIDGEAVKSGIQQLQPGEHLLKISINESINLEKTILLKSGEHQILNIEIVADLQKKS